MFLAKLDSSHHEVSSIKETVNYAEVFEIIKGNGSSERIIGNINSIHCKKIHDKFSSIIEIEVRVVKKVPPIAGFNGTVGRYLPHNILIFPDQKYFELLCSLAKLCQR